MLGEAVRCCHEVRFETRRCVKMRLRPGLCPELRWGSLLLDLGAGNTEGEMEMASEGTGTEGEEKGRRENGRMGRGIEIGGVCIIGFRGYIRGHTN